MNQKRRIFFDMDGTLAVFRKLATFEKLLEPGYFKYLPPIRNVVDAAKELTKRDDVEVFILSSYLTESRTALQEKKAWLDRYLPEIDEAHRIFVPCGEVKVEYVPNPAAADVLVDDYYINLQAWYGTPVKLFNGVNGTSSRGWNGASAHYQSTPAEIADTIRNAPERTVVAEQTQEDVPSMLQR